MQQVTTYVREDLELSLEFLFSFEYVRVFFFPRLTYNPFLSLDYLVVFVSYSNMLLGRGDGGTSS